MTAIGAKRTLAVFLNLVEEWERWRHLTRMSRFYGFGEYQPGETVRIADQVDLEQFARSWKLHHPLAADQIAFGGHIAKVKTSAMYHGGDILYELEGVPGIWHQQLLSSKP